MTPRGTKYWNSGAIPLIAPDILGNIITEVADLGIVIDNDGKVLSVLINPNYEAFRRLELLEGSDIRQALTVESRPKFDERLTAFLEDQPDVRPVELNHIDQDTRWEFPIRYSFHHIGPDGAVLMLGRDLRPVAEMQQQLVRAQLSLERDYEAQREFETRFRVLMETTTDPVILVSLQSGRITDANALAASLLGQTRDKLTGSMLTSVFDASKTGNIRDQLSQAALSDNPEPCRFDVQKTANTVVLHAKAFRVTGERFALCRMVPTSGKEAATDSFGDGLRQLFLRSPDAIVFTDDNGQILSANEGFLDLLDTADSSHVRGKDIAQFMQRGTVDFKVMIDNAARTGKMRMYATKVAGEYGSPRSVEIAVTAFEAGMQNAFAFVIREANRVEANAGPGPVDDNMKSVVELVGSAKLRDIVAETTNVVEKMCIETAIELTMNNRVAAAEMLGLSRQSLYVKLRKFGMLGKDEQA